MKIPGCKPQDIRSDVIKRAIWLDDTAIKGAPYFEIVWIVKDISVGPGLHTHNFDEFVGFMGGNISTPMELGGEVEFRVAMRR